MRRDLTLCDSILREVRDRDGSEQSAIAAHQPHKIRGHLELLAAEGLLDIGPRAVATSPRAYVTRLRYAQLTWKGHEYLDSSPQSRWRQWSDELSRNVLTRVSVTTIQKVLGL